MAVLLERAGSGVDVDHGHVGNLFLCMRAFIVTDGMMICIAPGIIPMEGARLWSGDGTRRRSDEDGQGCGGALGH